MQTIAIHTVYRKCWILVVHLPSNISIVIALETMSRDARSLAIGAYRSMKNSPLEFTSLPPSPRLPSVIKMPLPYNPSGKIDWLNVASICPRGPRFRFPFLPREYRSDGTGWTPYLQGAVLPWRLSPYHLRCKSAPRYRIGNIFLLLPWLIPVRKRRSFIHWIRRFDAV